MTFTMMGRCKETGRLGIATATNALAVGVRVPFIRPNLGAVSIMAIADPRLGDTAMHFLEIGYKAPAVIDALVAGDPYAEYRQLGVIDDDGFIAARNGDQNRDYTGYHIGDSHLALGNALKGEHILDAMEEGYMATPDDPIEDRLMRSIEAGRDAGGQHGGQRSAAILVYGSKGFSEVNLRVDIHDEPVGELRRVYDIYRPTIPYYNWRLVDARVPRLDDWLAEQQGKS
ncbi:MAG: DUF1028 domain-containing protein [Pseudomonadota bacterium]